MSREIKFRAWDTEHKEMTSWLELLADKENDWHGLFTGRYPKIELLQYTGLKDKNGKEIYEGDIVEWTLNPMGAEPEKNRAEMKRLQHGLYVPHINSTSEVIGNIYENPELLKEEV